MDKRNLTNEEVEAAYQKAVRRYLSQRGVTAVEYGHAGIEIAVAAKQPESLLPKEEILPKEIDGVPVSVREAVFRSSDRMPGLLPKRESMVREAVLRPGISIGHPSVTAGTLGAIVVDAQTNQLGLLTNWHVGEGGGAPSDPVLQPGPVDGGRSGFDRIATLRRSIIDRDGDAAFATFDGVRPVSRAAYGSQRIAERVDHAQIGDVVEKSGRTTGVTRGRVSRFGVYNVDYSRSDPAVGTVSVEGMRIEPLDSGNPFDEEISMGGDSGSAWLRVEDGALTGLHFAGEASGDPHEHAIAGHAARIFERLSLRLATEDDVEAHRAPARPQARVAERLQPNPFKVFRYFHEGIYSQSYSSWFPLWGGVVGAAHASEGLEGTRPPFATGKALIRPGDLDAALYGVTVPDEAPRQLRTEDRVRLHGFPAGSEHLAVREGYVYMKRPGEQSWITVFNDGEELAVGGMSGGIVTVVLGNGIELAAGILVTQNGRADVDQDGDFENGADIVSLRDVWEAIRSTS